MFYHNLQYQRSLPVFGIIKVSGRSMEPRLACGDYVITWRGWFRLNVGDLVVVNHPKYHRIIKKIIRIQNDGSLYLAGMNAMSMSSEKIGRVSQLDIAAKVILVISRKRSF